MKENITIKSQKSFLRFKNVILNVGACLGGGGWGGGYHLHEIWFSLNFIHAIVIGMKSGYW